MKPALYNSFQGRRISTDRSMSIEALSLSQSFRIQSERKMELTIGKIVDEVRHLRHPAEGSEDGRVLCWEHDGDPGDVLLPFIRLLHDEIVCAKSFSWSPEHPLSKIGEVVSPGTTHVVILASRIFVSVNSNTCAFDFDRQRAAFATFSRSLT